MEPPNFSSEYGKRGEVGIPFVVTSRVSPDIVSAGERRVYGQRFVTHRLSFQSKNAMPNQNAAMNVRTAQTISLIAGLP
jgi:hypothetical protein